MTTELLKQALSAMRDVADLMADRWPMDTQQRAPKFFQAMRDIDAALSKPSSEDAREGFVSVPVDPTEAMLDAAEKLDWSNEDIRGNCCNMFQVMIAVAAKGDGK